MWAIVDCETPNRLAIGVCVSVESLNLRRLAVQPTRLGERFGNVPDSAIQQNFMTFDYVDNTSEAFDVQFIDKGDVATAPDTGTTASLFGLSLTGLAFLRRKLW